MAHCWITIIALIPAYSIRLIFFTLSVCMPSNVQVQQFHVFDYSTQITVLPPTMPYCIYFFSPEQWCHLCSDFIQSPYLPPLLVESNQCSFPAASWVICVPECVLLKWEQASHKKGTSALPKRMSGMFVLSGGPL